MEDPSEEWKIEEDSAEANGGKVSWILNKGLILGRKVLIAGLVVSSTPILVPPLLAISAIGFVVLVPSGFLLASYACTKMLMRKLLVSNDEEQVYLDEEKEDYMEKEEEELMEETKRRVEMRIELVEEKNEERIVEDVVEMEENGYEEDVGEYLDEESGNNVEEDKHYVEERQESAEEGGQYVVGNLQEMEIPCQDKNVYGRGEMEGKVGELKEEEASKVREKKLGTGYVKNIDSVPKGVESVVEIGGVLEGKSFDNNVAVGGMRKGKDVDNSTEAEINIGHGNEEQKPVLDKASVFHAGRAEGNYVPQDVALDFQLNRNRENVIFSNIDEREIADESGLDLFDDKCSYVVHGTAEESSMGGEATETVELSVSAVVHESSHNGLPSVKDIVVPSSELQVLYNEEKIWEKIEAMRSIVGYKAMPQKTCIEEVKALYIFTGVEPPTSFKDPSDLAEVFERLQFLMAIVGVK